MSPADLLSDLVGRGVEFQVSGDNLRFRPQDRLTSVDLGLLTEHKAVIVKLLRSEGREAAAIDRYPIIHGRVHFDFFHTPEDIEQGRWGAEFVPGYHVDPRQPSRLRGLCSPPDDKEPRP
jgi:TubC N-terminal docking domain